VWVVVFDLGGKINIGAAQSAMPQPTLTLTDMTDEDGGINCFSSVAGRERGDPAGMALLILPLVLAGALRSWRPQSRRRRVEK